MKKLTLFFALGLLVWGAKVGEMLPHLVLEGKEGGLVDGRSFDSRILSSKTYLVIYSDPDKKDLNEEFFQKVKKAHFDRSRYGSIAIVNMQATWLPNFLLQAILKKKQKSYPDTIYVKDKKRVLVKKWGVADNDQVVMIVKRGKVLFVKNGKLGPKEQSRALEILQRSVDGTNR